MKEKAVKCFACGATVWWIDVHGVPTLVEAEGQPHQCPEPEIELDDEPTLHP